MFEIRDFVANLAVKTAFLRKLEFSRTSLLSRLNIPNLSTGISQVYQHVIPKKFSVSVVFLLCAGSLWVTLISPQRSASDEAGRDGQWIGSGKQRDLCPERNVKSSREAVELKGTLVVL